VIDWPGKLGRAFFLIADAVAGKAETATGLWPSRGAGLHISFSFLNDR
jgi:hypothetical protein